MKFDALCLYSCFFGYRSTVLTYGFMMTRMSKNVTHWLSFEDSGDYDRLREILLRANYTVPGVLEVTGVKGGSVSGKDIPLVLQRTREGRPIDTLMRLFLARVPVPEQAVREAIAPMPLETLKRIGLLKTENGSVLPRLKLVPFDRFMLVQEIHDPALKAPLDFVIGVGAATLTMANFMIRRQSRMTLDLGTGCGLLALLKSCESDKIIATDRNPRAVRMTRFNARINAVSNLECREGDLFEPVADLRFDLILSNAPFVITPSSGYLYLDGGLHGDQFCQRLVRGAAEVLNEGGYCQFLCNWAHLKGRDWQERLAGWFKGTGCDTWVLRGATEDTSVYARKWIEHFEPSSSSEFSRLYDEWMDYYTRERIEAISMGFVTMRRNGTSENWFRIDNEPEVKQRDVGVDIIRIFELRDFLGSVQSDDSFMNAVLQPAPELRLNIEYQPSTEGWHVVSHRLQLIRPLAFDAQTDELGWSFISRCDGKRTVGEVLREVASSSSLNTDGIKTGAMHVIRHLIQHGFLLPAEGPAQICSETV